MPITGLSVDGGPPTAIVPLAVGPQETRASNRALQLNVQLTVLSWDDDVPLLSFEPEVEFNPTDPIVNYCLAHTSFPSGFPVMLPLRPDG